MLTSGKKGKYFFNFAVDNRDNDGLEDNEDIIFNNMTMNIGDKAPEILGKDEQGRDIYLSDYKGRKLVLYFYPKDNTSGCTAEACSLRVGRTLMEAMGA